MFSASWCSWCHLWAAALADPTVAPRLSSRWVIVHLDGKEFPRKKNLENPGAEAYMAALGDKGTALPFVALIRPSGKVLTTYTGYPTDSKDFDKLRAQLAKADPKLSAGDLQAIQSSLVEHLKGVPH